MSRQRFQRVDGELLVLDEDRRQVYRLPAGLVPDAEAVLSESDTSTSRRRFLRALAAGSIAGVVMVALPGAAAASSIAEGGAVQEEPAPGEADSEFSVSTTSGDGSVMVTVS